jgi:hypothetical protein
MDAPWRPYTSYGSTTFTNADTPTPDAGPPNPDAAGGASTNYAWDPNNANVAGKDQNTGRPSPLSGGMVPLPFAVDAPDSTRQDLQYTSGFDHDLARPNQVKGLNSDPQVPVPDANVINRGYLDNGNTATLSTRNPASIRQRLGHRTDGNSGKQPPTQGV